MSVTEFAPLFWSAARWGVAALAAAFALSLRRLLLFRPPRPATLAEFRTEDGRVLPVTSAEAVIGRKKSCDVPVPWPGVSRRHAVLTRTADGRFRLADARSKRGLAVNGEPVKVAELRFGDSVDFGGAVLTFCPPGDSDKPAGETDPFRIENLPAQASEKAKNRVRREPSFVPALLFLSLFQVLVAAQLCLTRPDYGFEIATAYGTLLFLQWIYAAVSRKITRTAPGPEIAAFFLTSLGFAVTVSAEPGELLKQFLAFLFGMVGFLILSALLRHLPLVLRLRYPAALAALAVLALNLLVGEVRNGAQNWINLGFVTVQPSEFIKIAFIFATAETLERAGSKRTLPLMLIFACACVGMLFLMDDFGTALIFFVTFMIAAFLCSGNLWFAGGVGAAAAAGAGAVMTLKPYVFRRFEAWGRAFELANSAGYQQSRTLIAVAGGGLLGLGGGNGFLRNVVFADTDLVMGIVSEEWGFVTALCAALCPVWLALGTLRRLRNTASSYYATAACATVGLFLFQSGLNLFGSVDLLPLTGVTFVFVSNGGSSLVACWTALAFVKALFRHRIDSETKGGAAA